VWKNFAAQNNNSASEDCLKLSIWTKHPNNTRARKPVLVFLHGGRTLFSKVFSISRV
jgi:carboxylesterase type B